MQLNIHAMIRIRSTLFDVFAIAWTILLSPTLPFLFLIGSPSGPIRRVSQLWVSGLLVGLRGIVGLEFKIEGGENIPRGPSLVIANHQSALETLVLSHLLPDASFISKKENARIPAVGWYLTNYPMIMIDRSGGGRAVKHMIEQCRHTIADNRSIIMFPEGTRKDVTAKVSFKRGAEILYSELNVPAVLAAVNSGNYWKPGGLKQPGVAIFSFLAPIQPGLTPSQFRSIAEQKLDAEKNRIAP